MYIEITTYYGEDEFSPVYEKATAQSFPDAEAEIARIGRHYAKDILDGKINEPDRQSHDDEAVKGPQTQEI